MVSKSTHGITRYGHVSSSPAGPHTSIAARDVRVAAVTRSLMMDGLGAPFPRSVTSTSACSHSSGWSSDSWIPHRSATWRSESGSVVTAIYMSVSSSGPRSIR